jgi:hypothetical protein
LSYCPYNIIQRIIATINIHAGICLYNIHSIAFVIFLFISIRYITTQGPNSQYQGLGKMSDYFACLDLISFSMSSALLALSVAGAAGAASGCGAGADSVTGAGAGSDAGAVVAAGACATGVCGAL